LNKFQACPLTFFFPFLHEKPTDQCFPFGLVPPAALGRKMGVHPPLGISYSAYTSIIWMTPLCRLMFCGR